MAIPAGILAMLAVATVVASALLDNVTTVLRVVPLTLIFTDALKLDRYAFLFSQIIASNIGGMATLLGDPPNILVGGQVGLTFNDCVLNLAPVVVIVLAVHLISMQLIWERHMTAAAELRARVVACDAASSP